MELPGVGRVSGSIVAKTETSTHIRMEISGSQAQAMNTLISERSKQDK